MRPGPRQARHDPFPDAVALELCNGPEDVQLQPTCRRSGVYALVLKFWHKADFVQTPLPVLCIVMFAVGIQFLLMGLLAEMLVRTYHESQSKPIYAVRERLGFRNPES